MSKNLSTILRGTLTGTLPITSGGTGSSTSSAALTALGGQAVLVPGSNIKTINGTSLLGSGDISITSVANTSIIRQSITATANQTVFTLANQYVVGINNIAVYINGVRQFPNTYAETDSNIITLSSGVPAGTIVFFEIGISSSISTTPTASIFRQVIAATTNQTVFTLTKSYIIGTNSVSVFVNGVKLYPGTYTETNTNTVTLATGVSAGTSVLFEIVTVTIGFTTSANLVSFTPTSTLSSTTTQAAMVETVAKCRRAFNIAAVTV